jgi:hypothetical protein
MAEYDPQEDYANDSVLSASGHANNMYSSSREQGIYSVLNGNVEYKSDGSKNISADLEGYQVLPGEFCYPRGVIDKTAHHYFDETMSEADGELFVGTLKGARFFAPHAFGAVVIQYTLFVSQFRVQVFDDSGEAEGDPPESFVSWDIGNSDTECPMYIGVFVNGVEVPGARIILPITVHVSENPIAAISANSHGFTVYENGRCQQHSGGIMLLSGISVNGTTMPTFSQGINSIDFRLYITRPLESYYTLTVWRLEGLLGHSEREFEFHQRCSIGHSAVSIIGLEGA